MLGLGSNLMYPDSAIESAIDISGQGTVQAFMSPRNDDENVLLGMRLQLTHNAFQAMGAVASAGDQLSASNNLDILDGTFDFVITRYTYDSSTESYTATTDTATVTGKRGYQMIVEGVGTIMSLYLGTGSSSTTAFSDFDIATGSNLFDFSDSTLMGVADFTQSSVLDNVYQAVITYNPPAGYTGTISGTTLLIPLQPA